MKAKHLIGAFIMAVFGSVITLFVYTKYFDKPQSAGVFYNKSFVEDREVKALLTSFQMNEGQIDFTYAAEKTVLAVVYVQTRQTVSEGNAGNTENNPLYEFFFGERNRNQDQNQRQRERRGAGSGVIISSDGYIITNNHVIENANVIEVTLNDNRTMQAKVVGHDPGTDIALLKIDADNLSYIEYGDSDALRLGAWVLAVGNTFGLTSTVTAGIVSAKGRNLNILRGNYTIESFIQTDAALNMGNSGGALVNTKGELVGIPSAIYSPSGASAGAAFAIPTSIVKKVIEDLKQFGEVQRAILGVTFNNVNSSVAERLRLDRIAGVLITGVIEQGAAADAGLKEDDVIIALGDITVNTTAELQEQVGRHRPGDRVTVRYIRDGREQTVSMTLKNVAGNTGVVTADMNADIVFGARLATLGNNERRRLNIETGVRVVEVNDGKFKDIGIQRGYVILSINDRNVNNPAEVRRFTDNETTLKSISGVQPNGTIFSYKFGN
jgi:Do/DeqQ family serine protease